MWSSDQIVIQIDDAERSEVLVAIETPVGGLTILGNLTLANGVLTIDRAHIQGLAPGKLGRAGLNAIGYRILEETGAKALVIQGSSRTSGRNPGRAPLPSGSPVKVILSVGVMDKPVSVALVIRSLGHTLKKAHDTIDRLAAGQHVPIELVIPDGRDVLSELADLNVRARVVERPVVDLRTIRQRLDLTQAEFAIRFGLELDTVQNWEQGRYSPDPAATVLLKVIEQNPDAVDAALAAG